MLKVPDTFAQELDREGYIILFHDMILLQKLNIYIFFFLPYWTLLIF